jgi:hypothetical protein
MEEHTLHVHLLHLQANAAADFITLTSNLTRSNV